eukprot:TRINITY_DN5626_c0_g1_i1.p1 TRINITY_DN5626_c0_g1~~TRINITY_DN5626_c0_g1_i1.p1  ORF type:complete len:629 (+),score=138.36 TRINITY_DN5626_c0_g1_i1:59-1945(+)
MGLLTVGHPLTWEEAKKYADHVRTNGIQQLINIFKKKQSLKDNQLLWGDEIEYMVVHLDPETRKASVVLRALDIIDEINHMQTSNPSNTDWKPEYAMFMLEGTPGAPYSSTVSDLLLVEQNMKERRRIVDSILKPGEYMLSIASFPTLGVGSFTIPSFPANGPAARSLFIPDDLIMQHPRFPTLTANIRERRGHNVVINVPVFKDESTPCPLPLPDAQPTPQYEDGSSAFNKYNDLSECSDDHIYMDAMGFGMGCCCLQTTFQSRDVDEARLVYDQLVPLAPIFIALTAASPVFRGVLAATDSRWNIISSSVDDRTLEERGLKPLQNEKYVIPKSRYASVSCYIAHQAPVTANDIPLVINEQVYSQLMDAGFDDPLSRHFAHLFIRDPLVIFEEKINLDNENESDHFENIQSTNWQTVRFKPPPPNSPIGWRVEFRPMEVQLTDFENAAFTVFIALVIRTIISFRLNLYMPISQVDLNMEEAQVMDAVKTKKFYFRRNLNSKSCPSSPAGEKPTTGPDVDLMSVNEIINGAPGGFPGLMSFVNMFLNSLEMNLETRTRISDYLGLVSKRASGELSTFAAWSRAFVRNHPDYRQDSMVSESICHDLLQTCVKVTKGETKVPALFGNYEI